MGQYLPIVALLVLATACSPRSASSPRSCWRRRGPRRRRRRPTSAASCPATEPPERFPVRFYLVAMIFIVFDIEIIFLYPVGRRLPRARRLRPRRDRALRRRRVRVVRVPHRQRRPRLGPGQAPAGAVDRARPSAPPPPRSAASASTAASPQPTPTEAAVMASETVDRLAILERRPRGPRPQLPHRQARGPRQVGPRPQRRGRPRSAWRAAPSR